MNYGLYISTSGALNAAYRQDLLTGNLANVNTAGFKPLTPTTRQRDPVRLEDGLGLMPSNDLFERLGAGVMAGPTRAVFEQGSIRTTGNDLDLAIRGDGFFTVLDENDRSPDRVRLTRDGRFTLDARGRMVLASNGMPLLGENRRPVQLDPNATVTVRSDGAILQNGAARARIGFVEVPGRETLRKLGDGQFVAEAARMRAARPASGLIEQGAIEESAVDEIRTLMDIESAARDAQANIGMIAYHDRLLDQVINRFARVA